MENKFKNFIDLMEYVEEYKAIMFPENFSWATGIAKTLPSLGLELPTTEKRAKIETILDKKNPIFILLSDGSKLFFTLDEFRRIQGKPERGKTMIVTMQRLQNDNSELPSQIVKCQVI